MSIQRANTNKGYKRKKIRVILIGFPGTGKSSLAVSAPSSLLVDLDFGADRIAPQHRVDFIQPKDYADLLSTLEKEDLSQYETIVIDTVGKLVSAFIAPWVMRQSSAYKKRDGSLSQNGYGAVGREAARFFDFLYYTLDKNVVLVAHAVEEKTGDETKIRAKVEGSTKNTMWESADLGGVLEVINGHRTIGFSQCDRYFAKGTRGINSVYNVPDLSGDAPNDFLTRLFERFNAQAEKESEEERLSREAYEAAMKQGSALIDGVKDADSANAAREALSQISHAKTSRRELAAMWREKVAALSLVWDKESSRYVPAPPPPAPPAPNTAPPPAPPAEAPGGGTT